MTEVTIATIRMGNVHTCQIGNRSDSSGFEEKTAVRVLDEQYLPGVGSVYLIRKDDQNWIGRATPMRSRVGEPTVDLYCTAAMQYTDDGVNARRTLGF